MRTVADYHIHSTYSRRKHGKSTIEEIVERAVELNLKEIAITDHGPKHYLFGIEEERIPEAKEIVIEMRKKFPQIKILYGVEANIINYDGTTDISENVKKHCDIILCGYHIGVLFSSFKDAFKFTVKNKFSTNMADKNAIAMANAMKKNNIYILTHPGDKIPCNIDIIAKAAEETDTILEINNSHGHLNAEEIKIASKYNVKFVINSDSHIKDNIGSYENGLKAAIEANLDLKRIINLE